MPKTKEPEVYEVFVFGADGTIEFIVANRNTKHETYALNSTLDHGRKGSRLDAALNALESVVLGVCSAGLNFESSFHEGVQTAYDAILNNYGD